MHPLLKSPRHFLLALTTWGAAMGGFILVLRPITAASWQDISVLSGPPLLLLFFILMSSFYTCRAIGLGEDKMYLGLLKHGLSAVLSIVIWLQISMLYSEALKFFFQSEHWGQLFQKALPVLIAIGFLFYIVFTLMNYLYLETESKHQLLQDVLQNKLNATRAELNNLKASIHPHFLFNSLTALESLTQTDPEKAAEVTRQLAAFLRHSLQYAEKEWTTLEAELDDIQHYLNIEKIRLGDRLQLELNIQEGCDNFRLPPFTLLPLIENAVKHGIEPLINGGTIALQIDCSPQGLFILTRNPLKGNPSTTGEGFGLSSLKKRLSAAFGQNIEFYQQRGDDFFSISLRLPERRTQTTLNNSSAEDAKI